MTRGTFANIRLKNLLAPGTEGGVTKYLPTGEADVDLRRLDEVQGGTARRWSCWPARNTAPARPATGPRRGRTCSASAPSSPRASSASTARTSSAWACCRCSSAQGESRESLELDGTETFDIALDDNLKPRQAVEVTATKADGDDDPLRHHLPHRHAGRSRVLPQRRDPAHGAAAVGEGVTLSSRGAADRTAGGALELGSDHWKLPMSLTLTAPALPLATDADGVIRVAGTRVTLDTVWSAFESGASAEEIVEQYPRSISPTSTKSSATA